MKVAAFRFVMTPAGVQEFLVDVTVGKQSTVIFCDVLAVNDHGAILGVEHNSTIAHLVEKWILEVITRHSVSGVDESALREALSYASQRLKKTEVEGISQVAVSATVMTTLQSLKGNTHDILIASVGDSRVYDIQPEGAALLFVDPLHSEVSAGQSPEDRLFHLHNAIGGDGELHVHSGRYPQGIFRRLAVVSAGLMQQVTEEDIWHMGLKPHDGTSGVKPTLDGKVNTGNGLSILTASFGSVNDVKGKAPAIGKNGQRWALSRRRRRRALIGVTVAVLIALCGIGLHLLRPSVVQESKESAGTWDLIDAEIADTDEAVQEYTLERDKTLHLLEAVQAQQAKNRPEVAAVVEEVVHREDPSAEVARMHLVERDQSRQLEEAKGRIQALETTVSTLEKLLDIQMQTKAEERRLLEQQLSEYASNFTEMRAQKDSLEKEVIDLKHQMSSNQVSVTTPSRHSNQASNTRRVHLVARGETLTGISTRYYGSSHRWQDIYEANKDAIPDKNRIKVGTPLVIP